jgi:hypothetical protein
MSDPTWPRDRSTDPAQPTASRVAAGFIVFAVIMMIMTGVFQALAGLVAIFDNALYVVTDAYPFRLNTPTWGWIDLIVGLLVAGAGWGVLGPDVGPDRRDHSGGAQRRGELLAHPLLPLLGDLDHRLGRLRDLGARRPRTGNVGALTVTNVGAAIMILGRVVELLIGINAEGQSLEDVTKPLTAADD